MKSPEGEPSRWSPDLRKVASELAWLTRVAHRRGLMDLMGHMSVRLNDGGILISPGPEFADLSLLSAEDVVRIDASGQWVDGLWAPPAERFIHLALYDSRPDVSGIIYASPKRLVQFGLAGADLLPVTHTNVELAHERIAFFRPTEMVRSIEQAREVVRVMASGSFCHLPGMGFIAVADSLFEALRRCDVLERLADMSAVVRELSSSPRLVSVEEGKRVVAQRPHERRPSRDPRRLYLEVEPFELPSRPEALASKSASEVKSLSMVSERIAEACRILYQQQTLVEYFEHVSCRIPGDPEHFAMSPARHFAQMEASDICILEMSGDCASIAGPYPPAPFRWFHRDILRARSDVAAIVHTHDVYSLSFVLASRAPLGAFRNGAVQASGEFPVHAEPSLVFSPEDRARVVDLLGHGESVHVLAHGTDFVSPSLESSVVMAIQREELCRVELEAERYGQLTPLPTSLINDLAEHAPSAQQWYSFYADRLHRSESSNASAHLPGA